jgi:putative transposase
MCLAGRAGARRLRGRRARSPPPGRIRSGRSTSSSTKPLMAGRSRSSTSPTSTPARRLPASRPARSTPSRPSASSRASSSSEAVRPSTCATDNGPELVAETLRDWCRFSGTSPSYIEPGAPWQNPYVESFNGHLRRELLEMESFNTLYEAQLLLEDWRHDYNHHRPHQSLNYQTPTAFAHGWHAQHQPAHS